VVRSVQAKAERDEISGNLQGVYARRTASGLELEFLFKGCTQFEASLCVAAAIRDAAAASAAP
jgi:hypothetical protein